MSSLGLDSVVSIHPYFQVRTGQMDACREFLDRFCRQVQSESGCLYYNFTLDGDLLFCREAYRDAQAVLEHLENCGPLLGEFLEIAELTRIELHGAAEELEQLKSAFAKMQPHWFVLACGSGH